MPSSSEKLPMPSPTLLQSSDNANPPWVGQKKRSYSNSSSQAAGSSPSKPSYTHNGVVCVKVDRSRHQSQITHSKMPSSPEKLPMPSPTLLQSSDNSNPPWESTVGQKKRSYSNSSSQAAGSSPSKPSYTHNVQAGKYGINAVGNSKRSSSQNNMISARKNESSYDNPLAQSNSTSQNNNNNNNHRRHGGEVPRYTVFGTLHKKETRDKSQYWDMNIKPLPGNSTRRGRVQSRVLAERKAEIVPDLTYDFDGDGIVDERDYFIGRFFDKEKKNYLTKEERAQAEDELLNKGFLDR